MISAGFFIFSHTALATLDSTQPASQLWTEHLDIEAIEVRGQRAKPQLVKEFQLAKLDFIELYNELNDKPLYKVICEYRRPVGTKIAVKECEPRYVKYERASLISTAILSGNRMPSDEMVELFTTTQRLAGFEHVAELVKNNDELKARWLKLETLNDKIGN